ncbi:transposase [Gymnodinialimonas sp. 57CJ19]|uniref:transposase n=1 Tax=Gymnodinialimonas sp. 57CJ19 TaxID=3138498 RepID=UPI003134617F
MGTNNYSDDFKRDAVAQITERGYPVREVSKRLGVSAYSLYKWLKLYGAPASNPKRKHTNNGMLSPVDFERRQQKLREAGV